MSKKRTRKTKKTGKNVTQNLPETKQKTENTEEISKDLTNMITEDTLYEPVTTKSRTTKSKNILYIILGSSVVIAIAIICGVLLYQSNYYKTRWYQNTSINGVDVSGQTLAESKENILKKYNNYGITIKARDNGSLTIDGETIQYTLAINENFDTIFQKEHKTSFLFGGKRSYAVDYDISYNKETLKELVDDSDLIQGTIDYPIIMPKPAKVQFSEEEQKFIVKNEIPGNKLNKPQLFTAIEDAMTKAQTSIDLTDTDAYPNIYKAPSPTNQDALQQQADLSNRTALRYIVWNMGKGVTEQITPSDIANWITIKNNKVKYNNTAIANWVESFCKKYKTVGITRTVTMHDGKQVDVVGGDYGWQLDYERTLKQTKKAIKAKISDDVLQAYIENPSEENKNAITLNRKVLYANTAYKKDYVNFTNDWDENNFIEISLKKQMVYVIKDGKVAFKCRTISGRPTPDRATKTGAYFIKEHNEHRVLIGEGYQTPVDNWVRITWTGTGFHSASWQNWSAWTKDYYKTRGSHGCLNLSPEDSAKIYKLAKYRDVVFIY